MYVIVFWGFKMCVSCIEYVTNECGGVDGRDSGHWCCLDHVCVMG